jgi:hypothetical protein
MLASLHPQLAMMMCLTAMIVQQESTLKVWAASQSQTVYHVPWANTQQQQARAHKDLVFRVEWASSLRSWVASQKMTVHVAVLENIQRKQGLLQLGYVWIVSLANTLQRLEQPLMQHASCATPASTRPPWVVNQRKCVLPVLLASTPHQQAHQWQKCVFLVFLAPSQLQLELSPSPPACCVKPENTARLLEHQEQMCAKIARQASISKQRVMTRQQIAGYVMLGHSLLSVGLCLQQHASRAQLESILTLWAT